MIRSGLVSITFRELPAEEIVKLVAEARLEGIEWGGDVHVPHGDVPQARRVRKMTCDAGLAVASYGSYYRVGHDEPAPFETVLETAVELGSPAVRVWAGRLASENANPQYRDQVAAESRRIADLAARANVAVTYEFHCGTLTDTSASTRKLLEAVAHENIATNWQPTLGASPEHCLEGISAMGPRLRDIHVFHWGATPKHRLPLAEGRDVWKRYLRRIASTGGEHFALLEFVKDDSPEMFLRDAETLTEWLSSVKSKTSR